MKEKKAIKLAKKYFHWWTSNLGLLYGNVDVLYVDYIEDRIDETTFINPDVVGKCWTDWRYQKSTILISTKKLCQLSKAEIEEAVVHELMHIFLNEMREDGVAHEERVATQLQKAFMWVRDGVREGANGS